MDIETMTELLEETIALAQEEGFVSYIYNNIQQFQSFITSQQTILSAISTTIVELLKNEAVNIHQPDGGFYIFPDFSNYTNQFQSNDIDTSEKLCVKLLNEKGVALLPASAFGFSESALYTRLCYVDFDGTAAISALEANPNIIDDHISFTKEYAPSVYNGVSAICELLKSL